MVRGVERTEQLTVIERRSADLQPQQRHQRAHGRSPVRRVACKA